MLSSAVPNCRIAAVGGDFVMQIGLWRIPVPFRHDDIPFDTAGARRIRSRQFAFGDAIRPVPEQRQRALRIETSDCAHHA